jgi:hypothetical protein
MEIVVKGERMSCIAYFLFLVFGKFTPIFTKKMRRELSKFPRIFNIYITRGLLLALSFILLPIDKLRLPVFIVYEV